MKKATRSVHFLIYKEGLLGFCKSRHPDTQMPEDEVLGYFL